MTVKSESGLFVVARIGWQRNTQTQYFDFLYGVKGQTEEIDASGEKQRLHIAICPDGNGQFIRLAEHNCEIESDMQYSATERRVLPQVLRIKSVELNKICEAVFSTSNPNEVVLIDLRFV